MSSHPIVCPGHTRAIRDLRYSNPTEDGIFLMSGTHDGTPMIRSAETGDWIGTFEGHKGACWSATLNFDASKALTAAADSSVRYWDALTGDCIHTFQHGHIVVKTCDFNSTGTLAISGCNDKKIRLFNLEDLEAEPQVIELPNQPQVVRFSPDDSQLVIVSQDAPTLWVFDRVTLTKVLELELPGNGRQLRYNWSKTELAVAAGSFAMFLDSTDYSVKRQFEVATDKGYEPGIEGIDQHPDGSIFVTGGNDHFVRMHNGATGEVIETQRAHHGPVHAVAFHPHGTSYATGAGDSAIRIWRYTPPASLSATGSAE